MKYKNRVEGENRQQCRVKGRQADSGEVGLECDAEGGLSDGISRGHAEGSALGGKENYGMNSTSLLN